MCASVNKTNKRNYCLKALYIQSVDDLVIFDIDFGLQYIDLNQSPRQKVPVLFSGNFALLAKSTAVTIYLDNSQYHVNIKQFENWLFKINFKLPQVVTHSGAVVRIHKKGNAFHITSSKLDFNQVRGIFGDLDNSQENDFTINGTDYNNNLGAYFDLYE